MAQVGQPQGGAHKDNGHRRREFGQEGGRAGGAEDRLAGAAESRADTCALAMLQKHDADQGQGNDDMDDYDDCGHINFKL